MGRCDFEKLVAIEPALDEIRKFGNISEKKPGIFYFKSLGFMHFHEKEGKIWADVRDGKNWGDPIIIPSKVTKAFCRKFASLVGKRIFKLSQ